MKNLLLIVLLFAATITTAQVGIGTTTPKAVLDIPATSIATPANTDGLLIPRINAFPATNPTVDQNGMMVFLAADLPGKPKGFYYWDNGTTNWIGVGGGKGWDVTGNAGTNAATNFIGTTDDNDLAFRRYNLPAGKISQFNTAIGMNSLTVNATGNNTAFGNSTLTANTNGGSNTAMGTTALFSNTLGNSNIGIGYGAMNHNTVAGYNTAVGNNTLFSQSYANANVLFSTNNTAVGDSALFNNNPTSATTGKDNTGIGFHALFSNSTGSNNIGIGANSEVPSPTASNQLSIGNVIYGTNMTSTAAGRIGIGETAPGAKFQISSATPATPANTDGIIIPRVSTLTAPASMTAAQNGMMVFLTTLYSGNQPGFYYWDLLSNSWKGVLAGNNAAWGLTGNSGTNPATNFIGTIDNVDVIFKRYNSRAGFLAVYNTALGASSLNPNSVGIDNAAFGSFALTSNVNGTYNTGCGSRSLFNTTDGSFNTACGTLSLWSNETGNYNVAMGVSALTSNKTGSKAVAIGSGAMQYNNDTATGYDNTNLAVGYQALKGSPTPANNTGLENTAIGFQSLTKNTTGSFNTAFGNQTLFENTTGVSNLAFGFTALHDNISGFNNTAVGALSLNKNKTGNGNVGIGTLALESNVDGILNTAIGRDALGGNTLGNENTAIGNFALNGNKGGSKAIAIGSSAMENANSTTTVFDNKNIAIGFESLKGSPVPAANTGNNNTAAGYQTLSKNSTGSYNVAIGDATLSQNTTGYCNVSAGSNALSANKTGYYNTAVGQIAMITNVAGYGATAIGYGAMSAFNDSATPFLNSNVAVGFDALQGYIMLPNQNTGVANCAVGYQAMNNSTSGSSNVAVGTSTLGINASGNFNTAVGNEALSSSQNGIGNTGIGNQTLVHVNGSGNVAIGNQAGNALFNGSGNTIIGAGSNVLSSNGSNQMNIGNVIYGANMDNLAATPANLAIGAAPINKYKLYNYNNQITANGVGQYGIYTYRNRNSQNDGTGYGAGNTNAGIAGYNFWGDLYTFGTVGYSYWDSNRCGGILGSHATAAVWSSLAYKASSGTGYAVYATAAPFTGAGRFSQPQSEFRIGGGFYGGIIGTWSRGNIGSISSGSLFASYNSGDEYTAGRQIELVDTGNSKTAAYTMTSTESIVYKKGKITLINGSARVNFDANYEGLLGDVPIVTTTPMGQCNGIYIESVDKTGFTIKELNSGTSNVAVSWIAVGDRIDAAQPVSDEVMAKDFDSNINEVMFNENNKGENAKAIWTESNKIQFGQLPANLKQEKNKAPEEVPFPAK